MAKGGRGKRKGSAFERKVCDKLSRWVDPDSEETIYWRSAMSGGRSTVRGKRGVKDSTQAGDITCIHPKGSWLTDLFVLECKSYKDLDIKGGLLKNKGRLAKFWKEVKKEAKKHDKHPMLIAKENNTEILLLLTNKGLHSLNACSKIEVHHKLWSQVMQAHIFNFESVVKS